MEGQQKKIIDLYVRSKLSEQQIALRLCIELSTVRRVLKKNDVKKRTISEAISALHVTKFNKKPFRLKKNLTPDQEKLKLAAVMLYWGEGTKKGNSVALSNSNGQMVAIFVRFLKEICGIDAGRLHVTLHRYPDHDEKLLKNYWSKITGIPLEQFYKAHLHPHTKGNYKKKSQYGTVSVQYSDTKLLHLINAWIAEYEAKLSRHSSVGRAAHL